MSTFNIELTQPTTHARDFVQHVDSSLLAITRTSATTFTHSGTIAVGDYVYKADGTACFGKISAGTGTIEDATVRGAAITASIPAGTTEVLIAKAAVVEHPVVEFKAVTGTFADAAAVYTEMLRGQDLANTNPVAVGDSLIRMVTNKTVADAIASASGTECYLTAAEFQTQFEIVLDSGNATGKLYHKLTLTAAKSGLPASSTFLFDTYNSALPNMFVPVLANRCASLLQSNFNNNVQGVSKDSVTQDFSSAGALSDFKIYQVANGTGGNAGALVLKDVSSSSGTEYPIPGADDAARKTFLQIHYQQLVDGATYANATDVAVGDYVLHQHDTVKVKATLSSGDSFNTISFESGQAAQLTIAAGKVTLDPDTSYDSAKISLVTFTTESKVQTATNLSVESRTSTNTLEMIPATKTSHNYGYFVLNSSTTEHSREFVLDTEVRPGGIANSTEPQSSLRLRILHSTAINTYVNQSNTTNAAPGYDTAKGSEAELVTALKTGNRDYGTITLAYVDASAGAGDANAGKLKVTVNVTKNLPLLDETSKFRFVIEGLFAGVHQYVGYEIKNFQLLKTMTSTQDIADRNSWRVLTDASNQNATARRIASFEISDSLAKEDDTRAGLICAPRSLSDIVSMFANWDYVSGTGYRATFDLSDKATLYNDYRVIESDMIAALRAMAGVGNVDSFDCNVLVDITTDAVAGGFTKKDGTHFLHYADSKIGVIVDATVSTDSHEPNLVRQYKLEVVYTAGTSLQLTINTSQASQEALEYDFFDDSPFGTAGWKGKIGETQTINATALGRLRTHFISTKDIAGSDISYDTTAADPTSGGFKVARLDPATYSNPYVLTSNDTDVRAHSYIQVVGHVSVGALTIAAGTFVEFKDNGGGTIGKLTCASLTALGTEGNTIVFRHRSDEAFFAFDNDAPQGYWDGIVVTGTANMAFCTIVGGMTSLTVGANSSLDHVTIMDAATKALETGANTITNTYMRLVNNAGADPASVGSFYKWIDGRFIHGTDSTGLMSGDSAKTNYYMATEDRHQLALEWVDQQVNDFADASMGIFMFYSVPASNTNSKEFIRIGRKDNDTGLYAYAANLMDPSVLAVATSAKTIAKEFAGASQSTMLSAYTGGANDGALPQGLYMEATSNDKTGVLTTDAANKQITLTRNFADEMPTTITVKVQNGNGQLYAIDSRSDQTIAITYKEALEAEFVTLQPVVNPYRVEIKGGVYGDGEKTLPSLANKTQVVIDGTVILKAGAAFACGAKTDIVFVEKQTGHSGNVFKHDASALILDGGSVSFGQGCLMRGHLDYSLQGVDAAKVAGFFVAAQDAAGTAYVLNRKEYKFGSADATPANLDCFVPCVGMTKSFGFTGEKVTDGIRLPATAGDVVITDVMIMEQDTGATSLRIEPSGKLMSRQWPLDAGSFAMPTMTVSGVMAAVGDKSRQLHLKEVKVISQANTDLRYAKIESCEITVGDASAEVRFLDMSAGKLTIGSNVASDIRDLKLTGTTLDCQSSKCVLQHIETDTAFDVDGTPTIRHIKSTTSNAKLLGSTSNISTTLGAAEWLPDTEDGTNVIPGANKDDIIIYQGANLDQVKAYVKPVNPTDLAAFKTQLGATGYFVHVGSRLAGDVQQFGTLSSTETTEKAFGSIIVGGIQYPCEAIVTSAIPDGNGDRTMVLQTAKMNVTLILKDDGSVAAATGKLLLNNIQGAGSEDNADAHLTAGTVALSALGMSFDAKLQRIAVGGSLTGAQTSQDASSPFIVSSELGRLDRGNFTIGDIGTTNKYLAIYGAATSVGNVGSYIALIGSIGNAISSSATGTLDHYYVEGCSGDAVTGTGVMTLTNFECVQPDGAVCSNANASSTDAYIEVKNQRTISGAAHLAGTFTTPKGPYDWVAGLEALGSTFTRVDQWWHPRAKAATISSHISAPAQGAKLAELRRIGENTDAGTLTNQGTNCTVAASGVTAGANDAEVKAKATIAAAPVAELVVAEVTLFAAKTALPTITSQAAPTKEKRLTDQTAIGDEVAFAATGLGLGNAAQWSTRMIVEATNPDGSIAEKLLPANQSTLSGSYTFVDSDKVSGAAQGGRQGVKIGNYTFARDDIAYSNDDFIHQKAGFFQPKPRAHFAHSDNSLTIRVYDVPTIAFEGPTDASTAAGTIATDKNLVFVKNAPDAAQHPNTIGDMDHAAVAKITFAGSDGTVAFPSLQASGTNTNTNGAGGSDDQAKIQFSFAPNNGKITIDTGKATADETNDTWTVTVDPDHTTAYDGESNGAKVGAYMAARPLDSTYGGRQMTFSTVKGATIQIGTGNGTGNLNIDNLVPHKVCQTAIQELPTQFQAATFFTSNNRVHRDIAQEVSFTKTAITNGLADFIGTYVEAEDAQVTNQTEGDRCGTVTLDRSACFYPGVGHFKTEYSGNVAADGNGNNILQGICVIDGTVTFQGNVTIKKRAQILFKDNAKFKVAAGKNVTFETHADVSEPILARHIDDANLEGSNGRFEGFDFSGAGTVQIKNVLMVGGRTQFKLAANSTVGGDENSAVRMYNAAVLAVDASAQTDGSNSYIHIRNAQNALKLNGDRTTEYVLIENCFNKVIEHTGAAPTFNHVNLDILSQTATPTDAAFSFGASPSPAGSNNRILKSTNKRLPRNGNGFQDNGDGTATLGSSGNTINVAIQAPAGGASRGATSATVSTWGSTTTDLSYLPDTMADGLARQVAKKYLPGSGLQTKVQISYNEKYDRYINTSSAIVQSTTTGPDEFEIDTKNYGLGLGFSGGANFVYGKASIRHAGLAKPSVVKTANGGVAGDLTLSGLSERVLFKGEIDTTLASVGQMKTSGAAMDVTMDAAGTLTIPDSDVTQFLRLVAEATPVKAVAAKETAAAKYFRATTMAYYGQRPELWFTKTSSGNNTANYSKTNEHAWLMAPSTGDANTPDKTVLQVTQAVYTAAVAAGYYSNFTKQSITSKLVNAFVSGGLHYLVVEFPEASSTYAVDAEILAQQPLTMIITGGGAAAKQATGTISSNAFASDSIAFDGVVPGTLKYDFHNTYHMPLFDDHAYGIASIRNPAADAGDLQEAVLADTQYLQVTAKDEDGKFSIERKANAASGASGAVTAIDYSAMTVPEADGSSNKFIQSGIFQSQSILKASQTEAYISDITFVDVAELPDIQPLGNNKRGLAIQFGNAAGKANDDQEISQIRITPTIHADTSSTANLLAGSPAALSPIKEDYTFTGQDIGVNVHKKTAGDTAPDHHMYGVRTDNFGSTIAQQVQFTYKVTFPKGASYALSTSNLPNISIGDEPKQTATSVTLNGVGTKLGIYDELEHAFKQHAPYIGKRGGAVVLQNFARTGFLEDADAPELYEITSAKSGRLANLQVNTVSQQLEANVVKETLVQFTGLGGTASESGSFTLSGAKTIQVGDVLEQTDSDGFILRDSVANITAPNINTLQLKMTNKTTFLGTSTISVYRNHAKLYDIASGNLGVPAPVLYTSMGDLASYQSMFATGKIFLLYNEKNMSANGKATVKSNTEVSGALQISFETSNAATDMQAGANLRFLSIDSTTGATKQIVDFVSPHANNKMKTEINDGTNKVCNNLVLLGLDTESSGAASSKKYLVHMQLKSGTGTKDSVAFVESLVGGGSQKPNPYVLENRNVYAEGMITQAHGREPAAVTHVAQSAQQVVLTLTNDDENADFAVGTAIRHGFHTATVGFTSGNSLTVALAANDKIWQSIGGNGVQVGTVKTQRVAGAQSFELENVNYAELTGDLFVGATFQIANTNANKISNTSITNHFTGSSGVVVARNSATAIQVRSVQGHFDGAGKFFKQNATTGRYEEISDSLSSVTSNETIATANEIKSITMAASHIDTTGSGLHELGNFDTSDANGPSSYLSGILVRKVDGGSIDSFEDQMFLQSSSTSGVASLLNQRDTSILYAPPAMAATAANDIETQTQRVTLTNIFDSGDTLTIKDGGAAIGANSGVLTFATTKTAAQAATDLIAYINAIGGIYSAAAVDANPDKVDVSKVGTLALTVVAANSGCEVTATDSRTAATAEVAAVDAQWTVNLETSPAYVEGDVVTITMAVGGAAAGDISYTVVANDTIDLVAEGLRLAIVAGTALTNAQVVRNGSVLTITNSSGALSITALKRGSDNQTRLDMTQSFSQTPSPASVKIMSRPASLQAKRAQSQAVETLQVGDEIRIHYKLGSAVSTKDIALVEADQAGIIAAGQSEFWGIKKVAQEIRDLGFYAYVDANHKLNVAYEAAADYVKVELLDTGITFTETVATSSPFAHTVKIVPASFDVTDISTAVPATGDLTFTNASNWGNDAIATTGSLTFTNEGSTNWGGDNTEASASFTVTSASNDNLNHTLKLIKPGTTRTLNFLCQTNDPTEFAQDIVTSVNSLLSADFAVTSLDGTTITLMTANNTGEDFAIQVNDNLMAKTSITTLDEKNTSDGSTNGYTMVPYAIGSTKSFTLTVDGNAQSFTIGQSGQGHTAATTYTTKAALRDAVVAHFNPIAGLAAVSNGDSVDFTKADGNDLTIQHDQAGITSQGTSQTLTDGTPASNNTLTITVQGYDAKPFAIGQAAGGSSTTAALATAVAAAFDAETGLSAVADGSKVTFTKATTFTIGHNNTDSSVTEATSQTLVGYLSSKSIDISEFDGLVDSTYSKVWASINGAARIKANSPAALKTAINNINGITCEFSADSQTLLVTGASSVTAGKQLPQRLRYQMTIGGKVLSFRNQTFNGIASVAAGYTVTSEDKTVDSSTAIEFVVKADNDAAFPAASTFQTFIEMAEGDNGIDNVDGNGDATTPAQVLQVTPTVMNSANNKFMLQYSDGSTDIVAYNAAMVAQWNNVAGFAVSGEHADHMGMFEVLSTKAKSVVDVKQAVGSSNAVGNLSEPLSELTLTFAGAVKAGQTFDITLRTMTQQLAMGQATAADAVLATFAAAVKANLDAMSMLGIDISISGAAITLRGATSILQVVSSAIGGNTDLFARVAGKTYAAAVPAAPEQHVLTFSGTPIANVDYTLVVDATNSVTVQTAAGTLAQLIDNFHADSSVYAPSAETDTTLTVTMASPVGADFGNGGRIVTGGQAETAAVAAATSAFSSTLDFTNVTFSLGHQVTVTRTESESTTCKIFEALQSNASAPYLHTFGDAAFYNSLAVGDAVTIEYLGNSYSGEIQLKRDGNAAVLTAAIHNFPGGNANTDVTIRKEGGTATESAKITYYTGDKATMLNAVAAAISVHQTDTATVTGDKISIETAQGVEFAVTIGSSLS